MLYLLEIRLKPELNILVTLTALPIIRLLIGEGTILSPNSVNMEVDDGQIHL